MISTHVFAQIFDPKRLDGSLRQDLRSALEFLEFSDQVSLTGPQSTSLTLPATVERAGGLRSGWSELLSAGDLIRIHAQMHDGQVSRSGTVLDGVITNVGPSEQLSQTGYQGGTTLLCENLSHYLQRDSVAWWMYYGSVEGWTRARQALPLESLSGRLDKVMAEYTSKVAFHFANWRRSGAGLGERIGYHYSSLKPNVPVNYNLAMAEGPHLNTLAGISEPHFHEFFTTTLPHAPAGQGYAHAPTFHDDAFISTPGTPPWDGGRTWLILRPRPWPTVDGSGQVSTSAWRAIPLFDVAASAMGVQVNLTYSDASVRNFWMVQPAYQALTQEFAFTSGIAAQNERSIERHTYSPTKASTNLVLAEGEEKTMLDLARELTMRLAVQQNRAEDMGSGTLTLDGLYPQVQPGGRIRFHHPHSFTIMQAYISARSMQWNKTSGGSTTFSIERALPESIYNGSPAWFSEGITPVNILAAEGAPNTVKQE